MTSYEMLKLSVWKTEDLTRRMEIRNQGRRPGRSPPLPPAGSGGSLATCTCTTDIKPARRYPTAGAPLRRKLGRCHHR
jgi:hypothetical protein